MRPLVATLFGPDSRRWIALVVAVTAHVALLSGCEPETSPMPGPSGVGGSTSVGGDGGDGGDGGAPGPERCEDGATRACEVDLGTHRNVTSCFRGVQTCVEGDWGPCKDAITDPPPPAREAGPVASQAQMPERSDGAAACSCVDAA